MKRTQGPKSRHASGVGLSPPFAMHASAASAPFTLGYLIVAQIISKRLGAFEFWQIPGRHVERPFVVEGGQTRYGLKPQK